MCRNSSLFAGLSAAALIACGGANGSELFGPPDNGGNGGDSGGSADSGSGGGHPGNPSDGGGNADANGLPGDAGAMNDVSAPGEDAQPPKDAGHPQPPFACGTDDAGAPLACSTPDGTCCANQGDGLITMTSYGCVSTASACSGSPLVAISCHNGNDCGGEYCCGLNDGVNYQSVQCSATCPQGTDAGVITYYRFCDPSSLSECSDLGLSCVQSTLLPGFYHCG
jgi:hypothetical protein